MENTKYGKQREGRWTPIRAKAQDTRANPNSWETHLVRKRWNIGLLRALSLRIMMISIAPLQVLNYSEVFPTQHGYCARISQRNTTGNCEYRACPRSQRGERGGVKPMTLRTKGVNSTKAPPRSRLGAGTTRMAGKQFEMQFHCTVLLVVHCGIGQTRLVRV